MPNQDSSFYTNHEGAEVVWKETNKIYYVVRNGEMRFRYYLPDGEVVILRYTSDLEKYGIDTDQKLNELLQDETKLVMVNNSWFEVRSKDDGDYYSDVIDELDQAIEYAKELNNA